MATCSLQIWTATSKTLAPLPAHKACRLNVIALILSGCATLLHILVLSSIPTSDLEDLPELSHLTTTNQPFLTGNGYSFPYAIVQENTATDHGLSPSCLGSPLPSPTPSFGSSLSPSSFCDPFSLSDSDSFLSSPVTPDWPSYGPNHQNNDFVPNDAFTLPSYPHPAPGPHRPRSKSSPSRNGPVASKAMLEANGRRRRHPAQFKCDECPQTFTALFSLKREFPSTLLRTSSSITPHARPPPITLWGASLCMRHPRLLSAILQ